MGQLLGDFCASLQVSVQDGSVCLNPRSNKHYRDQEHRMLRADYYELGIMGGNLGVVYASLHVGKVLRIFLKDFKRIVTIQLEVVNI
jgi:hypothetical protein